MRNPIAVLAGVIVLASVAVAQPAPASQTAGREKQWWKGRVTVPMMPLDVVVVFTPKGDADWTATIDIPLQGADDLPLSDVALAEKQLRFRIPPPADALFELERDKDAPTASGTMAQRGMTFPVTLERITEAEAAGVGPERPQTPKPPFPYGTRDVTYKNDKDGVTLAGTLSIPEGKGPHPAVLLITGSGPQDRDETLFGHKPFAVIADYLTRRGIAVLRVDDRGVGGSTKGATEGTSEDFATDVQVGIKFLREQPELDGKRIALLGHSEGALIAPMVAAEHRDLAAIVLLAPPGLAGREILRLQLGSVLKASGVRDEKIEEQLKIQREALDKAADGAPTDVLRPLIRELVNAQAGAAAATLGEAQLDAMTDAAIEQIAGRWMRFFIKYDPREALKRVQCPTLALFGEKDFQVPPKDNLSEVESALKAGGNKDVLVKTMPGLNHLFQEAQTGQFAEYAQITQTISPQALDEVANWMASVLKVPAPK